MAAAACLGPPPSPTALVERAAAKTAALKNVAFDLVRVGEPVLLLVSLGLPSGRRPATGPRP